MAQLKLPQRNRAAEGEEYGRERKGIAVCLKCRNVHFKKKWHASLEDLRKHAKDKILAVTRKETCPACAMIKGHLYEGEVFVEGFPARFHTDLLNLINNFGERATSQDPQDRIIKIEKNAKGFRITTTENQLADRLAKKIKDAFNTVKIHFSHSKEPYEFDQVHVVFRGV